MYDIEKNAINKLSEDTRLSLLFNDISSLKDILLDIITKYPNAYKEFSEKNASGLMRTLRDKITVDDMEFIIFYTEINFAFIFHLLERANELNETNKE